MLLIHFIILCGSIIQTKQQCNIVAAPTTQVSNSDEPAGPVTKKYQLDENDAICSKDGRRCFRGKCLDSGRLLVNTETGDCVLNSNPNSSEGPPIMGPCPSPSSPMDRFARFYGDVVYHGIYGMPYFGEDEKGEMKIKYKCLGVRTQGNMSYVPQFFDCGNFSEQEKIEEFNIGKIRTYKYFVVYQNDTEVLLRMGNTTCLNDSRGRWRWETPLPTPSMMCNGINEDDEGYEEKCTTDLEILVDFVPIEATCSHFERVAKMNVSLKSLYGVALDPGIIISWNIYEILNLTEIPSNCHRLENTYRSLFDIFLVEYQCHLGYIIESNRSSPAPIATFTFGQLEGRPRGEVKVVPTTASKLRPHSKSMPLPEKPLSVVKTLCSGFNAEVREILEEMKKNETHGVSTILSTESGYFALGMVAGIFLSSIVFAVLIWATNLTMKDGQTKWVAKKDGN